MNNFGGNAIERNNFSKIKAQIARNIARNRLESINRFGISESERLIDEFEKSLIKKVKKHEHLIDNLNIFESSGSSELKWNIKGIKNDSAFHNSDELIRSLILKNKAVWAKLLLNCSKKYDPQRLSAILVNFIYGGLLTASDGNKSWLSLIEVAEDRQDIHSEREFIKKSDAIISRGESCGRFVLAMRGKNLLNESISALCSAHKDCLFILIETGNYFDEKYFENTRISENILPVFTSNPQKSASTYSFNITEMLSRKGIPYGMIENFSSSRFMNNNSSEPFVIFEAKEIEQLFSSQGIIQAGNCNLDSGELIKSLGNAKLPVRIVDLSQKVAFIEKILSGGTKVTLNYYKL